MATFSQALDHLKKGLPAKRRVIKNNTVIQEYKGRLYHNVLGVRAKYTPTDRDLFAEDWELIYPKDSLELDPKTKMPVERYS